MVNLSGETLLFDLKISMIPIPGEASLEQFFLSVVDVIDPYLAKRRTANHPCPVCGKHYVNEGSLRKHLACHPETSQLSSSLRMWPCSVCQAVFTHESGTWLNEKITLAKKKMKTLVKQFFGFDLVFCSFLTASNILFNRSPLSKAAVTLTGFLFVSTLPEPFHWHKTRRENE